MRNNYSRKNNRAKTAEMNKTVLGKRTFDVNITSFFVSLYCFLFSSFL